MELRACGTNRSPVGSDCSWRDDRASLDMADLPMCMNVPHLRYVVAAADHSSFRRAALALKITQPTLSKRIREVEDWLGIRMFERSTSGAQLTRFGQDFVASARRVLAELETMEARALAASKGYAGRLDIGFYTSLSTGSLHDKILQFNSRYPGVEVNPIEESRRSLVALLERGAIDIIVTLGEPNYTDYAHKRLWSDRIMVAFPKHHPLATREFIYWTDLKNECFLISPRDPGPEIQDILLSKLSSPGDRPQIKKIKANRGLILSLVESNRGITLTCESATGILLQGVVFREVRDGNGPTRVSYVAYWRNANENPALKQFLNLLSASPLIPSSNSVPTTV